MRATAFLVRWQGGWVWREYLEAPFRIETCQGQPGDGEEVIARADAEILSYGLGQTEITVGLDLPAGFPRPGIDWKVGDEVFVDGAWREVKSLTYVVDDATGRLNVTPQFGALLDGPEERVDRTIGAIGALSKGTSKQARPVQLLRNRDPRGSGT